MQNKLISQLLKNLIIRGLPCTRYFHDSSIIFLQVQNAALAAMKDEMFELAARFTRVTKERDYMEKALNRLQVSNVIIYLESFAQSICPDKMIFVLDKIKIVSDKIFFVLNKKFCTWIKSSSLVMNCMKNDFLASDKIFCPGQK